MNSPAISSSIDSRSFVSNLPLADRLAAALTNFEVEALDYVDPAGVAKRVLVAHRGGPGGLALSGHMDTVPDTGWQDDPFSARIDAAGVLHGLGSADMKGPVAAAVVAAGQLPASVPDHPAAHHRRGDHEAGRARDRRALGAGSPRRPARHRGGGADPADPGARPSRAASISPAPPTGVQAHSSTGAGRNANWALIPFLAEMKTLFERLRTDPALQDPAYDPPFSDFNLIDRQPRHGGERHRPARHRADQVPLFGEDRPRAGAGSGARGRRANRRHGAARRAKARRPNCRRTIR